MKAKYLSNALILIILGIFTAVIFEGALMASFIIACGLTLLIRNERRQLLMHRS